MVLFHLEGVMAMKTVSKIIPAALAAVLLVGCDNMNHTDQNVLGGAALGTIGGAAIGAIAGGGTGAWIGAGAGAIVGGVAGYVYDRNKYDGYYARPYYYNRPYYYERYGYYDEGYRPAHKHHKHHKKHHKHHKQAHKKCEGDTCPTPAK